MAKHMICKIQVSLFGEPATLIYNEDKSFMDQCERKIGEDALGDDLKGYFHCTLNKNVLTIGKRIKNEPTEW